MSKRPPNDGQPPNDDDPAAYKVGNRKPPKDRQFQKGQSGNPGGRKKNALSYEAALRTVLEQTVGRNKDGTPLYLLDAIFRTQAKKGLDGHWRAIKDLLDRLERFEQRKTTPRADADDAEEDEDILERALRRRSGQRPDGEESSQDGEDDSADDSEHDDDEAADDE